MTQTIRTALAAGMILLVHAAPSHGQQELAKLLPTLPQPANAIAYLNPPALKALLTDSATASALPKDIDEVWLASDLDLRSLQPRWEIGYAASAKFPSAEQLAKTVGGYVDAVANHPVVWTPRQSYLVPHGPTQLGFVRPANRQLVSSWLNNTSGNRVSDYLASQTRHPEQFLSFLLAIELENLLSPVQLAHRVEQVPALKGLDPQRVVALIATLRGISVIIGRRSLSECIVRVEFGSSPQILEPVAVPLLSDILKRNGSDIPEIARWTARIEGNAIVYQGQIEESTLDSLLGIFSIQKQADEIQRDVQRGSTAASPSPTSLVANASKEYFDQVTRLVERVRRFSAQTTGARAKWNDQIARRIDDLGTLNVDPQLVEFGANVASILRANSLTIRQGTISAGAAKATQSLYHGGFYSDGYSGYFDPNSSTDYQRVIAAQARAGAYADYRKALSDIDQLTSDIRRTMTQKLQIQF